MSAAADLAGSTARAPAILIVDDNPAKRLSLKAALWPLGYAIVEASSGVAALRCVSAQDFAVILLDVRMPDMDGFETAAHIRKRRQSEMTPIIFITAHAKDEVLNSDLYVEGAVDVIFPPVPPVELRAKVAVFANLFIRAEALAQQAREVQASADRLRFLFDAAPIGIFQTDNENRYIYTNPRWSEIAGVSADRAIGQRWDTILGDRERTRLAAELPDGEQDWLELRQRFEVHPPGSVARTVLVTSKAIPGDEGATSGWVGTLADVTSEAGAEAAMAEARDKATEASRLKSDFLATMSHEIRTPMNGVIGMTNLLLETDLDARQRDYAETVCSSGEALLTIIDDILDFSKVEAGMLDVEDIEFSLRTVVDDVVDLLAASAQVKGLELVAAVETAIPSVVRGDPGRVRQVLTNLIGNAIKFTPAGEVVVGVALDTETGGADGLIRFDISDTGDGIPPNKLDLIMQPFIQADTSDSRKYGGTGLGLAISRQLVALLGGTCGVTSQLGVGSNFWFTISAPAVQTGDTTTIDIALLGVSILIVDGNASQRRTLSNHMSAWGMAVTTADSGEAALAVLRAGEAAGRPFALALLDRSMPEMDGLEVTTAIISDPTIDTRVVLMTRLGQELDDNEAAMSGVCATLSKPVHREGLRASLRVALGLADGDAANPNPDPPPAPPHRVGVGRLLLAEDNAINRKVAVAMLSNAGYEVDTVCNGAEAVQAVAGRPYDVILMDCQMPELNGYEATAVIRASEGTGRHTPIIAMTAGARQEDRERCLAEGMDSYLSKPVGKDALLSLVGSFFGGGS